MSRVSGDTQAVDARPSEEDVLRADMYALLARLLARAPSAEVLALLTGLSSDSTEFGRTLSALAAAAAAPIDTLEAEYAQLFIGLGAGELLPYASHYLTGFLNEKPLARLRDDMAAFGIAAAEGNPDPEDHVAALCEIMAGLIVGTFGPPQPLCRQQAFFQAHMAGWIGRFFDDLAAAPSACFYRPVGRLGRLFIDIETQAFAFAR